MDTGNLERPSSNKKRLAIFLSLALLLVAIIVIAIVIPTKQNQTPDETSNTSNTMPYSEVKDSFNNLVNTILVKDTSISENLTTDDLQVTKIVNEGSIEAQYAYAETLSELYKSFNNTISTYLAQHPNDNLLGLQSTSNTFGQEVVAINLYLRSKKFLQDLPSIYLKDPDNINSAIINELSTPINLSNSITDTLHNNLSGYYRNIANRLRAIDNAGCIKNQIINNTCVSNLYNNSQDKSDLQVIDELIESYRIESENSFKNVLDLFPSGLLYCSLSIQIKQ